MHQDSMNLLNDFSEFYYMEMDKLSYRVNVFDVLHTNENAHSRLLVKFLNHKPVLLSFIEYLTNETNKNPLPFDVSLIEKPRITAENLRIDALICEKSKYAIIIENKINGAVEQKRQIANYIDKCKKLGYRPEQIFVLYLTKCGELPSDQTWGSESIKDEYRNRFMCLSYKEDLLKWLEDFLLKTDDSNDSLIRSALVQYIDHLKFFTSKTTVYKNTNKKMESFIKEKLELSSSADINIEKINRTIRETNLLNSYLQELLKNTYLEIIKNVQQDIEKENFDTDSIIQADIFGNFFATGLKIKLEGEYYSLLVGRQSTDVFICLYPYPKNEKKKILSATLASFFTERSFILGTSSYYYKYVKSLDSTYQEFRNVFQDLNLNFAKKLAI